MTDPDQVDRPYKPGSLDWKSLEEVLGHPPTSSEERLFAKRYDDYFHQAMKRKFPKYR